MPADFVAKQGDSGPTFVQALSYTNSTIPDLTGATIQLVMRSLTSAAVTPLTGTVISPNPVGGIVQWTPSTVDTAVAGLDMANWTVTFPDTQVMSFPTDGYLWIQIEANLTAETEQLVSLPDVKEYLGMVGTQHDRDHELLTMIEGMRPQIEQITGPIIPTIFDEKYNGGNSTIVLRNRPNTGYGQARS